MPLGEIDVGRFVPSREVEGVERRGGRDGIVVAEERSRIVAKHGKEGNVESQIRNHCLVCDLCESGGRDNTVMSEAIVMILGPFLKVVTPISFNDSTIWA